MRHLFQNNNDTENISYKIIKSAVWTPNSYNGFLILLSIFDASALKFISDVWGAWGHSPTSICKTYIGLPCLLSMSITLCEWWQKAKSYIGSPCLPVLYKSVLMYIINGIILIFRKHFTVMKYFIQNREI